MSGFALAGRLVLASVLAAAAAAKLVDLEGSRDAAERFGVPTSFARPFGLLLPIVELTLAALLIPVGTAPWAALAAAGLLVGFSGAIARSIVRGDQHDCHCFGRLGSSRVGPAALVRTLGLATLAGLVAAASWGGGGASALGWIGGLDTAGVVALVLGTAMALHVAFSWQLFEQNGRLIARVRALEQASNGGGVRSTEWAGLPIGATAPPFELCDLDGASWTLDEMLGTGAPVALVFSDPECDECSTLPQRLDDVAERRTTPLEVALVSRGDAQQNRAFLNGTRLGHVLLQDSRAVLDAYRIRTLPSATVVDVQGCIAAPTVSGGVAIEELLVSVGTSARDQRQASEV